MEKSPDMREETLNGQQPFWDGKLSTIPEMFGEEPSEPALKAAEAFGQAGVRKILELGSGQGRDTMFFAGKGFEVVACDYAESGIRIVREKARRTGLSSTITARVHDARHQLPFADESFDGCYSHMLFCMALTRGELEGLSREVGRVLRPGSLCIYTARTTEDPHYGKGLHRGEDMYEMNGFIVHFFSRDMVYHLAQGLTVEEIREFEEGELPRKLFLVILRKLPRIT